MSRRRRMDRSRRSRRWTDDDVALTILVWLALFGLMSIGILAVVTK